MPDSGRHHSQRKMPLNDRAYAFVPLPRLAIPCDVPCGHHRYHQQMYSGVIQAQIIAHTPVHVSSGILEETTDRRYPLVRGHVRSQGVLTIPGSALKGCLRSIVEAISLSHVTVTRARLPREYSAASRQDRLDIVERIFGAASYKGVLCIRDAMLVAGASTIMTIPVLFAPRPAATTVYFEERWPRGRKFYMHGTPTGGFVPVETCSIGSRFLVQCLFDNLTAGELGLILIGMGIGDPRLYPKLGAGKPACLGTIEMTDVTVAVIDPYRAYTDVDVVHEPIAIAPLLAAAKDDNLIVETNLQQLSNILRYPREDRTCTDRS